MATDRTYSAGRFALAFGGSKMAGWLQSVQGGGATSDVVVSQRPGDLTPRKHLAGLKYEDLAFTCGTGMAQVVYDAIKAAFDGTHGRFDGAVHSADYDGNIKTTLEFFHGLIGEVSLPALDATAKDPATMIVKISPESTRLKAGSGKVDTSGSPNGQIDTRKWIPANFRLSLAGLNCTKVSAIGTIGLTQRATAVSPGPTRDQKESVPVVDVSNLVVTLAESTAQDWFDWHKSFVIDGVNGRDKEKGGTLEYLASDLKTTLFKLDFDGLGIFKLAPAKSDALDPNIRRVTAEMYCNQIKFSAPGASH